MSGAFNIVACHCIVSSVPVWLYRFPGLEQLLAGIEPVEVSSLLEDQEIGSVGDNHIKNLPQDAGEPIVGLVDSSEV